MTAFEFSPDSLRVFRKVGLTDGYVNALRKPVESLVVMGSEAVVFSDVDDALAKVEVATRRLRNAFRSIDGCASVRSEKAVSGFLLDEELAIAFPEVDDESGALVGSALRSEIARVGRVIEAIERARQKGLERFQRPRGRPPAWSGVPPIFHALHSHWIRRVGGRCAAPLLATDSCRGFALPAGRGRLLSAGGTDKRRSR